MKRLFPIYLALLALVTLLPTGSTPSQDSALGLFEKHGDIGSVSKPGAVDYDRAQRTYLITGGGENMWSTTDAFHFVWKRMSGDVSLAADIRFPRTGGNAHRKAVLLIRQSLEADSAYADAALHGDGLTSLQYREIRGGPTREVQSNVSAPRRIRIEREGDYVSMSVAREGEALQAAGGSFKVKLSNPFFVGLAVCAHDNKALEKAVFSNVEITSGQPKTSGNPVLESTLETIAIGSKDRRVVHHARAHFEAPNWSRDGKTLLFNQGGRMYEVPVRGGEPQLIDTGIATRCNNDHGLSSDGKTIYFNSVRTGTMQIWRMKADGSHQQQVTSDEYNNWFPHPSSDGKMDCLSLLRKGRNGPPGEQGCHAPHDAGRRRGNSGSGETVRRTGDHQCAVVSRNIAFVSYRLVHLKPGAE